jgi:hypothetical protein
MTNKASYTVVLGQGITGQGSPNGLLVWALSQVEVLMLPYHECGTNEKWMVVLVLLIGRAVIWCG